MHERNLFYQAAMQAKRYYDLMNRNISWRNNYAMDY